MFNTVINQGNIWLTYCNSKKKEQSSSPFSFLQVSPPTIHRTYIMCFYTLQGSVLLISWIVETLLGHIVTIILQSKYRNQNNVMKILFQPNKAHPSSNHQLSLINTDSKMIATIVALLLIYPDQTGLIKNRYASDRILRLFNLINTS